MAKILIAGGTGLIGLALTEKLKAQGHTVVTLSRNQTSATGVRGYAWSPSRGWVEPGAFEGVEAVINLAGAGVVDRPWTDERKATIVNSRVQSNAFLVECIRTLSPPVRTFITASGINYYGTQTADRVFTEQDEPGQDFLGQTCVAWENAAEGLPADVRVVKLRTGMVLSSKGGALTKMETPAWFSNVIPHLGNGKQWVGWIHINDVCNAYLHALSNENVQGAYNLVAPEHANNKTLTQTILKHTTSLPDLFLPNFLQKKFTFPLPGGFLKLVLGKRADLVLKGSRISCSKLIDSGFEFEFERLDEALLECLTP